MTAQEKDKIQQKQQWEVTKKELYLFEENFGVALTEQALDRLHADFMVKLQSINKNIDPTTFENTYMRAENTYLRRKIELKDRQLPLSCYQCHTT